MDRPEIYVMKKIRLLSLTGAALVGFGSTAWAGPHGGGGGFAGGGHFSGSHFGSYAGGPHAAPAFSGGARFSGRSDGALTRAPHQFSYYSGARMSGLTQHAFVRQPPSRSVTANAGSRPTMSPQQTRATSLARQNARVGNSQMTAAAVRRAIANHNVFARHDGNWHRDWDKHRFHFHQGHVFVFIDGFWWGLDPWFYSNYAYDYPYDSYGYNPYGYYNDSPYDYYNYYPSNDDDQPAYTGSDQYGDNATVSAVQSQLAKLGYYRGAIDGVEGDETQAALARYQEDHDLSVTGTLTAATLQSLGLRRSAS
jgi:Putative peptidoglycan binding domain